MSVSNEVAVLRGEIAKTRAVLARLEGFYDDAVRRLPLPDQRNRDQAIVLADTLVNYYTGLETIFLRISQFFENSLRKDRWHQDLLSKMTLAIENVREPVVTDRTQSLLDDLLRFRHFKRYYYDIDYDWARIDFVRGRFDAVRGPLQADLDRFDQFLERLEHAGGSQDEPGV
ncbi:MAG TPA: hypothetical protein PKE26_06040 [Kiritimatiellia bacterium]|nr:hypothetical protein [Kiritimatiellia bacterium]HMO98654.1 hypothetical protein [Kiritimatiellia bacterium]HMP90849.1 hypothetical protein [Kiritimatiellia bacterium]